MPLCHFLQTSSGHPCCLGAQSESCPPAPRPGRPAAAHLTGPLMAEVQALLQERQERRKTELDPDASLRDAQFTLE